MKILDEEPFDLRKKENEELNCIIFANIIKSSINPERGKEHDYQVLTGTYIGEYKVPEDWELGRLHERYMLFFQTYHAIKMKSGVILISPKASMENSLTKGEECHITATRLELLSWKTIDGEKLIDPLAYERSLIKKFWSLIESTREKCKNNPELQKKLISKELLNWSYDEIWLFGDIVNHLSNALRFDTILEGLFKKKVNKWGNFCRGIVALGKKPFKEAISNLAKFSHDINTGVYGVSPEKIESSLFTLVQDVVEEKSGKTIYNVEELYLSKDIDDYQQRIYELLDEEHNLNQESD